jgi:hypothetical protein
MMLEIQSASYSGDSGSPILLYDTGKALGILRGSIGTTGGPVLATALCTALDLAKEWGLELRLLTADYEPPEATSLPAWAPATTPSITKCVVLQA